MIDILQYLGLGLLVVTLICTPVLIITLTIAICKSEFGDKK